MGNSKCYGFVYFVGRFLKMPINNKTIFNADPVKKGIF
jgi:hypothetical protein